MLNGLNRAEIWYNHMRMPVFNIIRRNLNITPGLGRTTARYELLTHSMHQTLFFFQNKKLNAKFDVLMVVYSVLNLF